MQVIDLHCDTISELVKKKQKLKENNLSVDLLKLKKANYLAQCFAMFVSNELGDPFINCLNQISRYYEELKENEDLILPVYCYDDIINNQKQNKISAILTIEDGVCLKNNLGLVSFFYDLGVRMITLTWNFINEIGYPHYHLNEDGSKDYTKGNQKDGLTPFGIEVIKEMNRLGIIIDVSHLSDKGFYDVCQNTSKPFVASHSNARFICKHTRNLDDKMILALAKNQGVMGINFYYEFLKTQNKKLENVIELIVDHVLHIVKVGGIDIVALGSDFDGISAKDELNDVTKIEKLLLALSRAGFSDSEIQKIFYLNSLRVFKANLA